MKYLPLPLVDPRQCVTPDPRDSGSSCLWGRVGRNTGGGHHESRYPFNFCVVRLTPVHDVSNLRHDFSLLVHTRSEAFLSLGPF